MMDIDQDKRLNQYSDKDILKRLMRYAYPYWKNFLLTLFFMVLSVGFALLEPFILGRSLDLIIERPIDFNLIYIWMGVFFGSIIFNALFNYLQTIILQKTGQSIIYNIREEMFSHIQSQDIDYFNQVPTGKLVTRVANDTNTLNEMYTSVIVNVFRNGLLIIGILGAMFILNVRLSLILLTVIPLIVLFSFVFRRFSRKAYREVRNLTSVINGFLAEHLSGMKIVQIFNQEKEKMETFIEKNTQLKKAQLKELLTFAIYRPTMYLLYTLALILIFYFGGMQVLRGALTIGVLFAFQNYVRSFFQPIQELAEQFNILQSAFASSERIFSILDSKPSIEDADDAIWLENVKGDIEFKDVWFAYKKDEWILKGVSFKAQMNQSIAFVGATGAGKTTILKLITRDFDIQKGQILIDGIDIKTIHRQSLRRFIGQMLQDVFMFSGTIKSNITLKEESFTDDDVLIATKYVNADRLLKKQPKGIHEEVRERGNNFSAGERQLISFARTLIHQPRIIILDEATANIDTETEIIIQDSLKKMLTIGTSFIVAHRLSTIQHVDQIIVMAHGQIIEKGSHQELLKEKGHYYNLYQIQFKDALVG
jgi:ATP-binding cassette, subfamily B, multidrug efflux pump